MMTRLMLLTIEIRSPGAERADGDGEAHRRSLRLAVRLEEVHEGLVHVAGENLGQRVQGPRLFHGDDAGVGHHDEFAPGSDVLCREFASKRGRAGRQLPRRPRRVRRVQVPKNAQRRGNLADGPHGAGGSALERLRGDDFAKRSNRRRALRTRAHALVRAAGRHRTRGCHQAVGTAALWDPPVAPPPPDVERGAVGVTAVEIQTESPVPARRRRVKASVDGRRRGTTNLADRVRVHLQVRRQREVPRRHEEPRVLVPVRGVAQEHEPVPVKRRLNLERANGGGGAQRLGAAHAALRASLRQRLAGLDHGEAARGGNRAVLLDTAAAAGPRPVLRAVRRSAVAERPRALRRERGEVHAPSVRAHRDQGDDAGLGRGHDGYVRQSAALLRLRLAILLRLRAAAVGAPVAPAAVRTPPDAVRSPAAVSPVLVEQPAAAARHLRSRGDVANLRDFPGGIGAIGAEVKDGDDARFGSRVQGAPVLVHQHLPQRVRRPQAQDAG